MNEETTSNSKEKVYSGQLMYDDIKPDRSSPKHISVDKAFLFLFQGMGGYDPTLVELGVACKERVQTIQITYPSWKTLLYNSSFDFETLVSDAVAQIAMCFPVGKILLAGYSFGGIVAFAVAARLQNAGRTVHFLGLLDIGVQPGSDQRTGNPLPSKTRRQQFTGFVAAVRRGEVADKLAYAAAEQLNNRWFRPLLYLYARFPDSWQSGTFITYLNRDLLYWQFKPLLREWENSYEGLPPLHAPAFLFRTAQHAIGTTHHLGWNRLCPNLTVLSVPGTHRTLLGPSSLPELCAIFTATIPYMTD